MSQALVIIDVQQGMFSDPAMQPFEGDATVARIRALLDRARNASLPVFFVQHDGGTGHPLARDSAGFAFHPSLTPHDGESVTIKTECNAFQGTGLAERLEASRISHLTVCGMQTQYCVDTFVRAAVEHGFEVCLAADGHTTFGTALLDAGTIIAHHNDILAGSFATLCPAGEIAFGA